MGWNKEVFSFIGRTGRMTRFFTTGFSFLFISAALLVAPKTLNGQGKISGVVYFTDRNELPGHTTEQSVFRIEPEELDLSNIPVCGFVPLVTDRQFFFAKSLTNKDGSFSLDLLGK